MKITGPGRRPGTVQFLFQSNRKVKVEHASGEFIVYRRRSRVGGSPVVSAADSELGRA
jgi:hypothetical protein